MNLGGVTSLLRHTEDRMSLLNGDKWLQGEVIRFVDNFPSSKKICLLMRVTLLFTYKNKLNKLIIYSIKGYLNTLY